MSRPLQALIYCRISKDTAGIGLGVERQERECRVKAKQLDAEVIGVLRDNDISGFKRKKRPGFEALQEAVRAGGVDVVIAYAPDRLTRHVRELEDLIDLLNESRTAVETVQGGAYDLTTPGGRMVARMLGNVARHESEMKSARLRSKMRQKAASGEVMGGGTRPYGYTLNRKHVVPAEADVIREMAARVLAGEPLRAIARDLNDRGVTTSYGKAWTGGAIAKVLKSARIAGLCVHQGVVTAEAEWPAIIDADTHRHLDALLSDPGRNTGGTRGREPRMLTGLITCGACGSSMKADSQPGGVRSYRCRRGERYDGCGKVSILAAPLEDLVGQAAVALLDEGALERAAERRARRGTDDAAVAELQAVEARRAELGAQYGSGEIGKVEWRAALDALERREANARAAVLADARAEVDATEPLALLADGVTGESWDEIGVARQRAVLTVLRLPITIAPIGRGGGLGGGRPGIDERRVSIGPPM